MAGVDPYMIMNIIPAYPPVQKKGQRWPFEESNIEREGLEAY